MSEKITKCVETGDERYMLIGVTIDDFIDTTLQNRQKAAAMRDITEEEFNSHPNRDHSITFDVEGRFRAIFYYKEYSSEEERAEWLKAIGKA